MKISRYFFIIAFMVFILISGTLNSFSQGSKLRSERFGVSAHLNFGKSSEDAIAIISISGEYNLWNRLSVGGGYAYLDGYLIQKQTFELFARGYALGTPFDIFGQAGLHFYKGGTIPVLKAGVEWHTQNRIFLGANVAMMLQTDHPGYLGGVFIGYRF